MPPFRSPNPNWWCKLLVLFNTISLILAQSVGAQSKTTYQDHVFPVIETHCARCHNPEKKKGDLDLTTYAAALRGGASGTVLQSGNPEGSTLFKVITHQDEPTMPPNKSKLPEKELDVFKRWITEGLLESSGGKPVSSSKPEVDLSVSLASHVRPDGPPPMPENWKITAPLPGCKPGPVQSVACNPWAPLLAVTAPKQIHLFHTETRQLLGTLPFPAGEPGLVRFSRSGQLLLAAGGVPGKSGRAVLWNVQSGKLLAQVGEELDTALAADLSPDQTLIAVGGPSRLVRIHSLKTGQTEFKIKKHTDWITALTFSPHGKFLATGDRNGGLQIWDPENGLELFNLNGHTAAIRDLAFRADSKILASISEDGTVKIWEMQEGRQVKSWLAHEGGGLALAVGDNLILTAGRNSKFRTWDFQGTKKRSITLKDDFPISADLGSGGGFFVGGTFEGHLVGYKVSDGTSSGDWIMPQASTHPQDRPAPENPPPTRSKNTP